MPEITIECPSGLEGRVRGMKGKEFRTLASGDKRSALTGVAMTQVIQSCWLETLKPGPYPNGEVKWDDALIGDRFYVLIAIRRASYPDDPFLDFDVQCQNRLCGKLISARQELSELELRKLPPESAERFATGKNRFETYVSDGRKVVFKLHTAKDHGLQKRMQDSIGPAAQGLLLSLASRIVEVEGLKSNSTREIFDFLDDLEINEHRNLLEKFEAADCGMQTDIGVECQWCGHQQMETLPLAKNFLLPRGKPTAAGAE